MLNRSLSPVLREGFRLAEEITRHHAKTFYFASLFLPPEKRRASYALYAVCRLSDATVDDATGSAHEQLAKMRQNICSAYGHNSLNDPLLEAFRWVHHEYDIPKSSFDNLLLGMGMDLNKSRYENFKDLLIYCYRVAGVIGLMMARIFNITSPDAERHAIDAGIAMQLTNILRDVKEDLGRGRIYLPQDELREFGVSELQLQQGGNDEKFKSLMRFQIARARQFYNRSSPGLEMIKDKKSRRVARMMNTLYSKILEKIEQKNYDVFSGRAHLTWFEKLITALPLLAKD
jgi:15-cis-phytoene synthase